ncbi:MAG: peptidase E [Solirubrobacteraceae bacterium]|nr:peptidase E [Solirubrobacteraceae bacterium]
MGGGGFTSEQRNTALDDFILTLAGGREPRILFLPTASGDPNAQIAAFRTTFGERACRAHHLSLFRLEQEPADLRRLILGQDAVYVGGGSMRNLLAIWREHGLDVILREAWETGVLLAGLSAGGMCWFQHGITRSTGRPEPAPALGFLPGSLSVHYDGDPIRRPAFLDAVARGAIPGGYGADDGVGLLFEDTALVRVVASKPGTHAYRVQRVAGEGGETVVESVLQPELLAPVPGVPSREVPDDIREFRAERYAAARRR